MRLHDLFKFGIKGTIIYFLTQFFFPVSGLFLLKEFEDAGIH